MTPKQNTLYWIEFAAVKRKLMASGYSAHEAEEWRQDTTIRALGKAKSSKDFNSRDLDVMLQHFRAVTKPDDLDEQIRLENAEKARLLHGIEQDKPSEAWVQALSRDIYGTPYYDTLPLSELLKIRRRCAGEARQRKRKEQAEAVRNQGTGGRGQKPAKPAKTAVYANAHT